MYVYDDRDKGLPSIFVLNLELCFKRSLNPSELFPNVLKIGMKFNRV